MRSMLLVFVSVYTISRLTCYGWDNSLNSGSYSRVRSNDIFAYSEERTSTSELPVSRWKSSPEKGQSLHYPTAKMTSATSPSTDNDPIVFVDEEQEATVPVPNGSSEGNYTDVYNRNFIKGPTKECPPGTKMDHYGNCRVPS
ncbi:hypothetical protein J6590_030837 [Homalodisca vitripennis]|nr:hypothetical protein J6590_030837 [Homalodisca vitripennis]